MSRGLRWVFFIVLLDAMGIGIVFPILPSLLRTLLHGGEVSLHYGFLLGAFAVSLFVASPLLGSLSDRVGRRPVLIVSLLGTAFDDLVMALAPTLSILYVGRILAGLTGANTTVANAYVADVTTKIDRPKIFGRLNAAFGTGFMLGPLCGSALATYSLRAPFCFAAVLNLVGAVVCHRLLTESKSLPVGSATSPTGLNPFRPLMSLRRLEGVGPLLYVFCTMAMVGQFPSVLWVLYGTERFGWSTMAVGCSFTVFGLLHALCQAFLPQVAQARLGQRRTIMSGMMIDSLAFATFSFVASSRSAFATIPLLSLGDVSEPAVQSLLAGSVNEDRQGELQGVLTSLVGLIAMIGPVVISATYIRLRRVAPAYPGAIWLMIVLLYLPCVLLMHFYSLEVRTKSLLNAD